MNLWIISDLHLTSEKDSFFSEFLAFLESHVQASDHLVLAGDIFDFFVSEREMFKFRYRRFFELIETLRRRTVAIDYIEGNHDFHFKKVFARSNEVRCHESGFSLEWSGKKVFIGHGDLSDDSDYGYHFLRFVLRSPLTRFAALQLPEAWVDAIGSWSAYASREDRPPRFEDFSEEKKAHILGVTKKYAVQKFSCGWDVVILGHSHVFDEWILDFQGKQRAYYNIGFPKQHRKILCWRQHEPWPVRVVIPGN